MMIKYYLVLSGPTWISETMPLTKKIIGVGQILPNFDFPYTAMPIPKKIVNLLLFSILILVMPY